MLGEQFVHASTHKHLFLPQCVLIQQSESFQDYFITTLADSYWFWPVKCCWFGVHRYLQNIRSHPGEEKYRRIRISNRAFQVVQYVYPCMHTYIITYVRTCVHTYTYIHTYIHTYTYIQTYICTLLHTYIHMYMRTQTYVCMYTCIQIIRA